MAFLAEFIITVVKMLLIAAVAFVGIKLGKLLRDKKDAKTAAEAGENKQAI